MTFDPYRKLYLLSAVSIDALTCYSCSHVVIFGEDETCLDAFDAVTNNITVETCSSGQVCQVR